LIFTYKLFIKTDNLKSGFKNTYNCKKDMFFNCAAFKKKTVVEVLKFKLHKNKLLHFILILSLFLVKVLYKEINKTELSE
jgi:hypothetical protein